MILVYYSGMKGSIHMHSFTWCYSFNLSCSKGAHFLTQDVYFLTVALSENTSFWYFNTGIRGWQRKRNIKNEDAGYKGCYKRQPPGTDRQCCGESGLIFQHHLFPVSGMKPPQPHTSGAPQSCNTPQPYLCSSTHSALHHQNHLLYTATQQFG